MLVSCTFYSMLTFICNPGVPVKGYIFPLKKAQSLQFLSVSPMEVNSMKELLKSFSRTGEGTYRYRLRKNTDKITKV